MRQPAATSPRAPTLARQRFVNGFRVEAMQHLVTNKDNRQGARFHLHQILDGALIARHIFLGKRDTFLR